MAIPDPPKAGSPFCALWTGGWNPKTPKINNFFIPEITLRGGYKSMPFGLAGLKKSERRGRLSLGTKQGSGCGGRRSVHGDDGCRWG